MFYALMATCLLALSVSVQSAPTAFERGEPLEPRQIRELQARRLLGSSFGLPGNRTFDYVVVGGGTAGLTVAARLAQDGTRSVAVIEAGSFYEIGNGNLSQVPLYGPAGSGKSIFDVPPLVDWGFVTTPQKVCKVSLATLDPLTDQNNRDSGTKLSIMLVESVLVGALVETT